MTERIILTVVAVVMLLLTVQKKEKQSIILTGGLTCGILLTWTMIPKVILIGFLIYTISSLFIALYGLQKAGLGKVEKTIISMTGFWAFVVQLFSIMHLPYVSMLRISLVIPVLLYVVLIRRGLMKKKEFGFLSIINVDFVLKIISAF